MDIVYTVLRDLAEPPSLDACRPLEYPGEVAALEQWRVVPTENGPYLIEGLLNRRGICSVVFAVYGRALARIAERWVVLGRPLDGTLSEYDDADVIRRAAQWIVAMDAKEEAEHIDWGDDPEVPPSFETACARPPQDEE
jgi:hypothetical protein